MKASKKPRKQFFVSACPLLLAIGILAYAQSNGIVVESVNNYTVRNGPSIGNSISNGDGFLNNMVFFTSIWHGSRAKVFSMGRHMTH